ncbi:MAG: DUF11 domain-containing protein [Ardenticatenales bacterium]|nr:DUF11 domain-containing protein [Ardenticatenales bacterium]
MLENDAWTLSDTLDVNNSNNFAFTQNTVLAAADMGVNPTAVGEVVTSYNTALHQFIVTDTANQVTAGKILRYQAQVQNNGPSDGRNVTIQENLPTAPVPGPVTFLRAVGADCRPDDVNQQLLFCDLDDMAAGARETFDVYVLVDPSVPTGTNLATTFTALQSGSNTVPPGPPPAIPGVEPTRPITWDPCLNCGPVGEHQRVLRQRDGEHGGGRLHQQGGRAGRTAAGPAAGAGPGDRRQGAPLPDHDRQRRPSVALRRRGDGHAGPEAGRDPGRALPALRAVRPGRPGHVRLRGVEHGDADAPAGRQRERRADGGDRDARAGQGIQLLPDHAGGSGYVLDGTDLLATDTANITTTTTDLRTQNNTDRHDTLIIAEADLAITKADDAAGFLTCDPVAPGGTITYDLTVTNSGPSDAADVYVVDQLPVNFVVVDPALVDVTVSRGAVVEVRDDGQITIRVGNDPNNLGVNELGRVNAGSAPVTIRITVTVRQDAACGQQAANAARVETRQNNTA